MRAIPALLGSLLSVAAVAQAPEIRGVWVARDGLTSRTQIRNTLDQFAAANVNLVAVNVWSRGYTLWPSDVLQAACGVRQDPTFVGRDPLQEFLTEAHRRGIQVEAWFEYGFMAGWSGWYPGTSGNGPVLTAHPDWIAMDRVGTTRLGDGNGGWFTWFAHEHPAARQFLIDLTTELVDRYDVDAVQWDRIRYPSTAFGYDPATVAAYRAAHNNQNPPTSGTNSAWMRWRADGLNAFALQLAQAVRARRPGVLVTNAPVPADTAYASYLQDWPRWLVDGAVDFVYPQIYRTNLTDYTSLLNLNLSRVRVQDRARFAPGIRAISGTPTSEVLAMVALNRQLGLPGHVFWYAEGLYDDLPQLAAQHFQQPAPVPGHPTTWRPAGTAIDDGDPGTSFVGPWSTQSNPAFVAGNARLLASALPAAAQGVFTVPVAHAGLWRVLVHAPSGAAYAPAAPHRLGHAGGSTLVTTDQTAAAASGWRELATVWVDPAVGPATVAVLSAAAGTVVADAAMLLPSHLRSGAFGVFGSGTTGSLGVPRIGMHGNATPGGSVHVRIHGVAATSAVLFAVGFAATAVPVLGGTFHVLPATTELRVAGPLGDAGLAIAVPFTPGLLGLPVWSQGLVLDGGVPAGAALTAAVTSSLH